MKFNWLRNREAQKQFKVKWEKGSTNQADYLMKHHPPHVHKTLRHDYILKGFQTSKLQVLTLVQTRKCVLKYV